jgi:hypothetical protein
MSRMSKYLEQVPPTSKIIETELETMGPYPRAAHGPALVVEATTES